MNTFKAVITIVDMKRKNIFEPSSKEFDSVDAVKQHIREKQTRHFCRNNEEVTVIEYTRNTDVFFFAATATSSKRYTAHIRMNEVQFNNHMKSTQS